MGVIFQMGPENFLYKKLVNTNLKQKKCFSQCFSPAQTTLLWSVLSLFFIVYILPPTYFFLSGLKKNFLSCSKWLGKFQISWDRLYWEWPNFHFGRLRARPFSSIKPWITSRVNLRIVDGKVICFMCVC